MKNAEKEIIQTWANDFGIALSGFQLDMIGLYIKELWEWNRKFNLTGLSSRKEIIIELLIDSLTAAVFLPEKGRLLDVGSGAGFPAIALKICNPGLDALLIEAHSKKVSFLKQVVRLTGLTGVDVIRGRVEKVGNLLNPEGYQIITARALASLPQTLAWCAPHLMSQGMIINFQGRRFQKALRKSSQVIKEHRLILKASIPYTLPEREIQRNLLVFTKGT